MWQFTGLAGSDVTSWLYLDRIFTKYSNLLLNSRTGGKFSDESQLALKQMTQTCITESVGPYSRCGTAMMHSILALLYNATVHEVTTLLCYSVFPGFKKTFPRQERSYKNNCKLFFILNLMPYSVSKPTMKRQHRENTSNIWQRT